MKLDIKKFFSGIVDGIKRNAPDIKMGVGTAAVITGTVVLCKEAVTAKAIMDEYHEARKELECDGAEKKDIRRLKMQTAGKIALNFLPGSVLEGSGLLVMWNGYSDEKAVVASISATCSGLQDFIDRYRGCVREEYGEEVDEKFAYNFRTEEVVVKDEDGNEKVETVRIYPSDVRKMPSPYARYFCYGEADGAERSHTYNGRFLDLQEELMNRNLKAHRRLMLNDCYDFLGIKRSKAGNHVGWIYDPNNPEGDNEVDLRAREVYRETLDENGNPNGWERVWMIDPNVDGMVEDKMVKRGLIDE